MGAELCAHVGIATSTKEYGPSTVSATYNSFRFKSRSWTDRSSAISVTPGLHDVRTHPVIDPAVAAPVCKRTPVGHRGDKDVKFLSLRILNGVSTPRGEIR